MAMGEIPLNKDVQALTVYPWGNEQLELISNNSVVFHLSNTSHHTSNLRHIKHCKDASYIVFKGAHSSDYIAKQIHVW